MASLDIVIAGADEGRRQAVAAPLTQAGHQTVGLVRLEDGADALALEASLPDMLVIDLHDPILNRPALLAALAPARPPRPDTLEAAERRHVAAVLAHTGWNRRQAALVLGISRSTLLNKIRRFRLAPPGPKR